MKRLHEIRSVFAPPVFRGEHLSINALGIHEWMPQNSLVDRPSTGDWLLMYFHTESTAGTSQTHMKFAKKNLIIWEPGVNQTYGNLHSHWQHSWVHLQGSFLPERMRHLEITPNVLHPADGKESFVLNFLRDLHAECFYEHPDEQIACRLLDILLMRLFRKDVHPIRPEVTKARQYMTQHLAERINLNDIAHAAGLSSSHLSALFKDTYGTPPMRFLNQLRMEQAAFLLRTRALRVGEAAQAVGFDEIFHFSKSFKTYFGYPPSKHNM